MEREALVQLMKSLKAIEKAIGDNDTSKVLRELLAKITDISAKAKGDKGDDGYTPKKGRDYHDGKDGRGIARMDIDEKGRLLILFTDGKEKNLGRIVGNDGKPAKEVDLEAMARKVLALVKLPEVDIDALASAAAAKVKKAPTLEEMVAAIKQDIGYDDLKGRPDLDRIMRTHIEEFYSQQDRGVYVAPGNTGAPIAVYDEGVLISDNVVSIDFRGGNINVSDLGNGALAVTVVGGSGANMQTENVTGVQEGDDVRIALSQLPEPYLVFQWISRNGFILSEGALDPDGNSTYEVDGDDILVHWALASDKFVANTTY